MPNNIAQLPARSRAKGGWRMIHTAVIETYLPRIGSTAFAVYVVLCKLADDPTTHPEQRVIIEQKALAKLIGLSRRSVQRALCILQKGELVQLDRQGTHYSANSYVLLQPPEPLAMR